MTMISCFTTPKQSYAGIYLSWIENNWCMYNIIQHGAGRIVYARVPRFCSLLCTVKTHLFVCCCFCSSSWFCNLHQLLTSRAVVPNQGRNFANSREEFQNFKFKITIVVFVLHAVPVYFNNIGQHGIAFVLVKSVCIATYCWILVSYANGISSVTLLLQVC